MALLSSIPFVLALSLAGARVAAFDIILFQVLMIPLFFSVILIFVTLVNATALIREEIEDNTIPYLLTRPISRPAVAVYKYIGYLAAVLLLLVPPILLAYGVTEAYQGTGLGADRDVLGGTVLGSAAYGALFLFISVLVRKPLAVGLLIGFVWESIVGSLPGDVPKLSVIHYLKSILKGMIGVTPLATYNTDISPGVAVLLLVGFSIAMIVLTMLLFAQMEFRQKA